MLTLGGNICYTFKLAIFNDHASAFSVEVINTFVLGVADGYAPADEGYSPRQVSYVHGHADFASHIFDNMFLDNLRDNAEKLTKISHTEYFRDAGSEGIELIMWLVRRGAMEKPREIYRHYHVPVSYSAAGCLLSLSRIGHSLRSVQNRPAERRAINAVFRTPFLQRRKSRPKKKTYYSLT